MIKRLIKKIVPQSVINATKSAKSENQLAAIPKKEFDLTNLRSQKDLSLDTAWHDKSIEAAWKIDHERLAKVIGTENLLLAVNPGDRQAIYYLVSYLKANSVLETGTHIAASSLHIAAALDHVGGKITTVDIIDINGPTAPWTEAGYTTNPIGCAKALNLQDRIEFVTNPGVDYLAKCQDKFDFIFLDGDHSSTAVYTEISLALKLLNRNGTILLHDYYPDGKALWSNDNIIHGPCAAGARVMREQPGIKIIPLGNLPWPTKLGSKCTSLAIVLKA